ncbi:MAG TPA: hypothetical protein VKT72_09420 [Candidatus Baltobacteraceae bacterium]|nr:hypothetical protein [Candidatus Baltobacteraceae bacterium]
MIRRGIFSVAGIAVAISVLAACSSASAPQLQPQTLPATQQGTAQSANAQSETAQSVGAASASVLATLNTETTIGSDVDPVTGDVNPYGLAVAPVTAGKLTAGDLVVCDFNDKSNVQGTGNAIVALHPVAGSTPTHITNAKDLLGCNAIAMAPNDIIWPADFGANNAPLVGPHGAILTTLSQFPWKHPFGEAFVPPINAQSWPAFYISNAGDGTLVRVTIFPTHFAFTTIATGFPVNHGAPGSILAPSGLNYRSNGDVLFVVDGTNNALYAISNISSVGAEGIRVHGLSFTGPNASDARVVYSGAPLNGPISSAILPGGNIAVGNTLDPTGKNLIVEISPSGGLVSVKNVDTGAAGAIFGMVATGTSPANAKLYFNDDNSNTLVVLSH